MEALDFQNRVARKKNKRRKSNENHWKEFKPVKSLSKSLPKERWLTKSLRWMFSIFYSISIEQICKLRSSIHLCIWSSSSSWASTTLSLIFCVIVSIGEWLLPIHCMSSQLLCALTSASSTDLVPQLLCTSRYRVFAACCMIVLDAFYIGIVGGGKTNCLSKEVSSDIMKEREGDGEIFP